MNVVVFRHLQQYKINHQGHQIVFSIVDGHGRIKSIVEGNIIEETVRCVTFMRRRRSREFQHVYCQRIPGAKALVGNRGNFHMLSESRYEF